jgi:chemotaxis protein MotB
VVLVDLPPLPDPSRDVLDGLPAQGREGSAGDLDDQAGRIETLVSENADLSARLTEERRRTAQLEAEHRQEIAGLETAKSHLGEEVAALAADLAALTEEVQGERRRTAELKEEWTTRRAAEVAARAEERATFARLVTALRREIAHKDVALEQAHQQLTVAIMDRVLFPSGQATLTPEGQPVIDKVGAALAALPARAVIVEGHTDNVPIGTELQALFPSNWELSAARATEVVKRLVERAGIASARLSAVGRADTEPVASNATEDGRRRNRRIEIIIMPADRPAPGEDAS